MSKSIAIANGIGVVEIAPLFHDFKSELITDLEELTETELIEHIKKARLVTS